MIDKLKLYSEAYNSAIRGWLSNEYSSKGNASLTAEMAHKIANIVGREFVKECEKLDDIGFSEKY